MLISKFIFLIITFSCISYSLQESKVKVSLFYEGLCPYCHEFIEDQLYPGYQKIGDYITLDLIPFGGAESSKTDHGVKFDCQHGPLECYINEINACVINLNETQSQVVDFLYCTSPESSTANSQEKLEVLSKKCANESNLSWDDINTCLNDGKSDNLLLAYERRQNALNPPLEYVPNIRFNDVFDADLEDQARDDFVKAVCELIQEIPNAEGTVNILAMYQQDK